MTSLGYGLFIGGIARNSSQIFFGLWAKGNAMNDSGIFEWETYSSIPGLKGISGFSRYKDSRGLKRTQENLECWIYWGDLESLGNKEDWIQGFTGTQ